MLINKLLLCNGEGESRGVGMWLFFWAEFIHIWHENSFFNTSVFMYL